MSIYLITLFFLSMSNAVSAIEYVTNTKKKSSFIISRPVPLIVYVYKSCACPRVEAYFSQLEKEMGSVCNFAIIQSESAQELFKTSIEHFPTIWFTNKGVIKDTIVGAPSKCELKKRVENL